MNPVHDHTPSQKGGQFETIAFFNNNEGRYKWSQPNGAGTPVNITYSIADNFKLNGISKSESKTLFQEALNVWADAAPLKFKEIKDPGNDQSVDIRAKSEFIDGNGNTLGFAFFPKGGDITFDSGERNWSPSLFLETAVHELGHSLGLDHENGTDAIMNSSIQGRFDGPGTAFLLQDDINGIRSLYGNGTGSVSPLGEMPNPNPQPNPNPNFNVINGNRKNNRLIGTSENDRILGRRGNDFLTGRGGNDELSGGKGRDRLYGSNGDDRLSGDAGRDRLVGGNGNDALVGGSEKDVLIGTRSGIANAGKGELDTLTGGPGADTFVLGTKKGVFYTDGSDFPDFAFVKDFAPKQGDILQLKGKASDYSLGTNFDNVPDGLTIAQGQGADRELVAVVKSATNFTLDSSAVRFV